MLPVHVGLEILYSFRSRIGSRVAIVTFVVFVEFEGGEIILVVFVEFEGGEMIVVFVVFVLLVLLVVFAKRR